MEIAVARAHYNRGYFSILILLAGFVNAETPSHTRLGILGEILERGVKEEFVEEFKKNLVGLSVSEVLQVFLFTQLVLLSRSFKSDHHSCPSHND